MNRKKISLLLIIRRFLAVFIFFSIAFGVISDFLSGNFTGESISGALVGLVIVIFLSRSPRSMQRSSYEVDSKESLENDEDIYDEETLEEFENFESDEIDTNAVINVNRQYNPVRDNESFFVRLFKKRTDRI
tara:strand:- start:39 stop:434 length:396 start_codon:yes stop_codon:yes gene_type:complete